MTLSGSETGRFNESGRIVKLLQQSVSSVIAEGRIGSLVFLRCMVQIQLTGASVVSRLAAMAAVANTWMPSKPERIYIPGKTGNTQITAMVQYAGGQTAMLSLNRIPEVDNPSVNLMLVGNKGVIHHETPTERHRRMQPPIEFSGGEELIPLLESAIKTGNPVEFE